MKIVHLTSAHPRDDIRIFTKQCRSLVAAGHDLSLIVADGLGCEVCENVRIIDVGAPLGRLHRMFRITRRVHSRALALDADVYHFHDPELLPVGLALRRVGKCVLFDAHEDVPKQLLGKHYLGPVSKRILSWSFGFYESIVCRKLSGVIAATPNIRDKFLRLNGNTVDINNYPMIGELESDLGWSDKFNEICYVGAVSSVRGIRELISAMDIAGPSVRLSLVGSFSEKNVENEVRLASGWERVNYLGILSRAGVRDVLARSRAGIVTFLPVPNHLDAQPNKMFEYMSAGIPVVASNFPLWREIVEGNDCGLCVDPLSPSEIAEAIDYLVSHPDEAMRMGENGRRAVLKSYNWAVEEGKLNYFYDGLQDLLK
jgi:glycosyltransferase involved in cell wall biosynthesis